MLSRILTVALCLALVSCKGLVEKYKRSNSGTSATEKKVLVDFRQPLPHRAAATPPPALPAGCESLFSVAGSFTYAVEQETAYLLKCGDTDKIVVYSGNKLQASSDTPFSEVLSTFDLNNDDKNEILLATETAKEGIVDREAVLADFEKNSLLPVEDFGTVYHDPCALFANVNDAKRKELLAGGRSPFMEAVVIYYLPRPGHQLPSFTAERYRAACPATPNAASGAWERLVTR